MMITVIRKPQAASMAGISKTNLWEQTKRGTFPPPISLGARAVGYLQHEIEAIIAARAAGKSEDEIREAVQTLVARRSDTANRLLSRSLA